MDGAQAEVGEISESTGGVEAKHDSRCGRVRGVGCDFSKLIRFRNVDIRCAIIPLSKQSTLKPVDTLYTRCPIDQWRRVLLWGCSGSLRTYTNASPFTSHTTRQFPLYNAISIHALHHPQLHTITHNNAITHTHQRPVTLPAHTNTSNQQQSNNIRTRRQSMPHHTSRLYPQHPSPRLAAHHRYHCLPIAAQH